MWMDKCGNLVIEFWIFKTRDFRITEKLKIANVNRKKRKEKRGVVRR